MAQLEQPSASVNAKASIDSTSRRDDAQPARSSALPLLGVVATLAIAAGAFVYYQNENESDTTTTAVPATSDNTASAPAGTMPLGTRDGSSSAQSATTVPNAGPNAAATASAHANAAKPHSMAKASKPTHALQPRERQVFLATRPQPTYPLQALRAGEEGTVLVMAQVDVDGQVTDARVVRPSGSRILDRAAPNEVRHWKFEPALHDGRPVVASVEVPVSYRLNQ